MNKKEVKKKKSLPKEKVEVKETKEEIEPKVKKRLYFGYTTRIIFHIIMILSLCALLFFLLIQAIKITKSNTVNYTEKSDIDYIVLLKDNNFYEQRYLEKNMAYVASLIDNIKINYNYVFEADKKSDIDIEYKIIAKLVIASQYNNNVFFEKEYDLTELKKDEINNKKQYIINESILIDYHYYNDLVNKFKSSYAVNTTSNLEVSLQVAEKNKNTNSYDLSSHNNTTLVIPLSEQEVSINLQDKNINSQKVVISNAKLIIKNIYYLIGSIILFIILLIYIIFFIKKYILKMKKKPSDYDKYVSRILRGYDRIIVNVKTAPKLENYNVIKVENFQELIDVRDNTKEPIIYYVIIEHQKCEFFVINDQDLYLLVIKEIDLIGKNLWKLK